LNPTLPEPIRPRWGLDGAATVYDYPPGVRRVATELIARLTASEDLDAIPLVPAKDEPERTWRHRELPRLAKSLHLAGLVSFTSAFPILGPGRRVQLIHELPWRHGAAENSGLGHRLWARHGWRRASAMVVPSERVLADLQDEAPRAANRAHVIPWGLSDGFSPATMPDDADRLARLGLAAGPFVLAAGATRPKKRLDASLAALALLGKDAPNLVVTGSITEQLAVDLRYARTLGLEGKLTFLGRVDEPDLHALTRHATVALVLADSEGFGLPALEALGSGTPVIVPPGTAQAEVAGARGITIASDDPNAIARAVREALNSPPAPTPLVEHAQNFTWAQSAHRLEVLLETLR